MKFEYRDYELSNAIIDIAAGPFGSNLKVSCFTETGFPIIDGANLKGITVTDNITKFVSEDKARSLHRSIAKRRDIVVTISGNVGQISYIPDNSQYAEYLCSQRQFRVTFDESKIYVPYLVYYLHSVEGRSKILAFANQTGVPALSQPLKNFRKIKIDLPSLENQHKIADILSTLDEKIATNRAINDNLQQQVQTLFADWLSANSESATEIALDNICTKVTDGSHFSPKDDSTSSIPMLSVKDMREFDFDLTSCKHICEDDYEKMVANDCVPQVNDILVAKDGSYLKEIFICNEKRKLAILSSIAIFRPNTTVIHPEILLAFLKSPRVLQEVRDNYVSGSALPRIVLKDFKKLTFSLPDMDAQNLIAPLFASIREQIAVNVAENKYMTQLRDTLLPKLMSGEINVDNIHF